MPTHKDDPFQINKLLEVMTKCSEKQKSVLSAMADKTMNGSGTQEFSFMSDMLEAGMKLMSDPSSLIKAQNDILQDYASLSTRFMDTLMGNTGSTEEEKEDRDKRFKGEEWHNNPIFALVKEHYLLLSKHINNTVLNIEGLDKEKQQRVAFFTRQLTEAMSPSNFLLTNPELLQLTLKSGGKNILEGFDHFLNDVSCSDGEFTIKMTDQEAFELGKNIAASKGKVVFQNNLIQLLQYTPTTKDVFQTPLLISPPFINKYYILDLNERSSLVKWLVEQGYTVFVISWVNPGKNHSHITFEDYVNQGHLEALDAITSITGEKKVSAIGYCTGGTLLASSAAYLAAKGEDRFTSLTYMATLIDFSQPGELGIFLNAEQVKEITKDINQVGYLDGRHLAKTFNMLRPNDLIWSYAINNYLKGKEPVPFDVLYWNSDSTNLPAAMYSFYLQNFYLENKLIEPGGITINGINLDLSKIKAPSYFLATQEDHIVLWRGAYQGAKLHQGPTRFVLGGSGHVAGIINAPQKNKYGFRVLDEMPENPDTWFEQALLEKGSWWTDWQKWHRPHAGTRVKARKFKRGKLKPIEDAPGSYAAATIDKKVRCKENCSCQKPKRHGLTQLQPAMHIRPQLIKNPG